MGMLLVGEPGSLVGTLSPREELICACGLSRICVSLRPPSAAFFGPLGSYLAARDRWTCSGRLYRGCRHQPGNKLGTGLSLGARWRAPGVLRGESRLGCCLGSRHARGHGFDHCVGTPSAGDWRRRCSRLERLQPGGPAWPRRRCGGPDQLASKGRSLGRNCCHARRCGLPAERRRPGVGGRGIERRPGRPLGLCVAPQRAREHPGRAASATVVVEVAHHRHRRGGERTRRGYPSTARNRP